MFNQAEPIVHSSFYGFLYEKFLHKRSIFFQENFYLFFYFLRIIYKFFSFYFLKLKYVLIFFYNCSKDLSAWMEHAHFIWWVPKSVKRKIIFLEIRIKVIKLYYRLKNFLFPKGFINFVRYSWLIFADYLTFAEPFFARLKKIKKRLSNFYYDKLSEYVDFKHYLKTLRIRSPSFFKFLRIFFSDFFLFVRKRINGTYKEEVMRIEELKKKRLDIKKRLALKRKVDLMREERELKTEEAVLRKEENLLKIEFKLHKIKRELKLKKKIFEEKKEAWKVKKALFNKKKETWNRREAFRKKMEAFKKSLDYESPFKCVRYGLDKKTSINQQYRNYIFFSFRLYITSFFSYLRKLKNYIYYYFFRYYFIFFFKLIILFMKKNYIYFSYSFYYFFFASFWFIYIKIKMNRVYIYLLLFFFIKYSFWFFFLF
jgi:hypothetical protein